MRPRKGEEHTPSSHLQPPLVTVLICMPVFTNLPPPTPANTDPKPPRKRPFLTLLTRRLPPQSLPHQNLPSGAGNQAGLPGCGFRVLLPAGARLGESSPRVLFLLEAPPLEPTFHQGLLSRILSEVHSPACLLGSLTLDSFPFISLHSGAFSPIVPPTISSEPPPPASPFPLIHLLEPTP